ncbi:MAG: hypothetical protein ACK5LP_07715 [Campylobacteraceae bacterium]
MKKSLLVVAFIATSEIYKHRFVAKTNDGTEHANTTLRAIGVSEQGCKAGEVLDVLVQGIAEVEVGSGGVVAGGLAKPDADGKAVTAASGEQIGGIVLKSGAEGNIVPVLLNYA